MLILGGDYQQIANLGSTLLTLSFSRASERNADLLAVNYLNDTDYDPKAFASFFERLNEGGESFGSFQFLSTHPNPENQIPLINDTSRKARKERIFPKAGSI
jgi:predicted Zn-dependent protease